jgi:hypothetical protein
VSHLENLIAEYFDWKGYLVKRNIKVGKRAQGGWEMELDVIAYHPGEEVLIHLEPSVDAHSWEVREQRFTKKFTAARKYILKDIFPWLNKTLVIKQMAVLITHPKDRHTLAGAEIISIDEFMAMVRKEVIACGPLAKNAIPEQYPLLRTLQMSHCGYYKFL